MKNYSILIVDDEENVTRLLNKVLVKEGYETHMAHNGEEALYIIDNFDIDIVISDIKMPGMSGIELLKNIGRVAPFIKVILITAFATVDTAIEALRMGAKDYITKPFDIEEVIEALRNLTSDKDEVLIRSQALQKDIKKTKNKLESKSAAMLKVIDMIKQIADTRATVMLYGETGTGKELAAETLHNYSSRSHMPFVKVNCAAIPENLLESELFGYEKGAFTGAVLRKPGKFELASGGSIFLDEIGDITLGVQVKLLRILQEKEFERLGGTKTIKVDVRIIAATNKNLEELVKEGSFREDLYYRLNVVPINMPPLRERKEDIPMLALSFLNKSSDISGKAPKSISEEALSKLMAYNWPGNIRELQNIIERCVVITPKSTIGVEDLPLNISRFQELKEADEEISKLEEALDDTEKEVILKALKESSGNRTKASEILGISRRSLHRKILKYNI
ncbi:sigma-54-dependent transcriptional regulator [Candidatus Clostridium radicumherbarum]|uniref:Stage 0 sporulation protein A homolog n=1 Tax=Candidatus Clostridium radicumherbarum TaxID=3381662 RepID=A0ABW8TUW8_9CLOT